MLVKAYGSIEPVDGKLMLSLTDILQNACGEEGEPILRLDGNMAILSFEGIYFPEEDLIACLEKDASSSGKIDILDIEQWRLRRYILKNGAIERRSGTLNDVLAYSGH